MCDACGDSYRLDVHARPWMRPCACHLWHQPRTALTALTASATPAPQAVISTIVRANEVGRCPKGGAAAALPSGGSSPSAVVLPVALFQ